MYYQYQDKKAWLGPVKVFAMNGNDIFVFANGNVRKVPRCNVQLCEKEMETEKEEKNETKVQFEEQEFGKNFEDKDVEIVEKRVTRSMKDAKREEMRKDEISTFWMRIENGVF